MQVEPKFKVGEKVYIKGIKDTPQYTIAFVSQNIRGNKYILMTTDLTVYEESELSHAE